MGRFSGMEISSSPGLKHPQKLAQGLIFEDFLTRGMKKFSYLKTTAHSEIVFLYDLTKQYFYLKMLFFNYILKKLTCSTSTNFFPLPMLRAKAWKLKNQFFRENAACKFPHGPCGNQISAWVMWKSDSSLLVQWRFHEFF